jgi:hypothetical protein
MAMTRADGLAVGEPIFVIQCFDREGYYTAIIAHSRLVVRHVASLLMSKTLTAMSLPFEGSWNGDTPVVTAPDDFKEALAKIDKGVEE